MKKVNYETKSEAWVKEEVKKLCRKYGAYYAMPVAGPYGRAGIPDFLICSKGRFIACETKNEGGKPTPLQLQQIREINEAGGTAVVIRGSTLHELEELLK